MSMYQGGGGERECVCEVTGSLFLELLCKLGIVAHACLLWALDAWGGGPLGV